MYCTDIPRYSSCRGAEERMRYEKMFRHTHRDTGTDDREHKISPSALLYGCFIREHYDHHQCLVLCLMLFDESLV